MILKLKLIKGLINWTVKKMEREVKGILKIVNMINMINKKLKKIWLKK